MPNETELIAILPGALTEYEDSNGKGFINLLPVESEVQGDKVVLKLQLQLDFSKLSIAPGKIQVVAQAREKEAKANAKN